MKKVTLTLVAMAVIIGFAGGCKKEAKKKDVDITDAYCGKNIALNNACINMGFMITQGLSLLNANKANHLPIATTCYQIKPDNKVDIRLDSDFKLSGSYTQSGNKFSITINDEQKNKSSFIEFNKKFFDKCWDATLKDLCALDENPKGCKKDVNSDEMKQIKNNVIGTATMVNEAMLEIKELNQKYSGDFLLIENSLHILDENCQSVKSFTKKGSVASEAFDESKQFCSDGTIYDKCGGKAYDIDEQKCENNIILTKCGEGWRTNEQFCSNGVVKDYVLLTDPRDSKKYKAVKIGTQTWMAENLNYAGKNDDIGSCYNKKPENCEKYGALYTWDEAMKTCPSGWHLPSFDEWKTLVNFAGGETAEKKLKAKNGWDEDKCKWTTKETTGRGNVIVTEHDECATDEFGFSALPGGDGSLGGYFNDNIGLVRFRGGWWSSADGSVIIAEPSGTRQSHNVGSVEWNRGRDGLLSVRCLKD